MSKTISFQLQQVLAEETKLRGNYSGRGMCGETCLAFTGEWGTLNAVASVIESLADDPERLREFADLLSDARTDTCGLGEIVYFPHWDAIAGTANEED